MCNKIVSLWNRIYYDEYNFILTCYTFCLHGNFAPCKGIWNHAGFRIPRAGFWIPIENGFRIPIEPGFQIPSARFRIPKSIFLWIPDSGLPYLGLEFLEFAQF